MKYVMWFLSAMMFVLALWLDTQTETVIGVLLVIGAVYFCTGIILNERGKEDG